ncbi:reverse transcriptase domain-containing protein, partial [Tanacetum coccineum]
ACQKKGRKVAYWEKRKEACPHAQIIDTKVPTQKEPRFLLLAKTPNESLDLEKGNFKAPPPMVTLAEKGTPTNSPKVAKKGEASGKDKPLAILMVQPWKRVAKQRITQSFSPKSAISFPPLGEEDGTEGPMIIEAEMGGHFIHRMYVDGGSASKILYKHCFSRLWPEVRSQMLPATTPLTGFGGEIIWPLRQISLLVKIGDMEHSTSAWMNFMLVRSPSPYNGIIGRPGVRRIQSVLSTAHGMFKFPVEGGVQNKKIKVAIHPEYPEQTVAIGSTLAKEGRKELRSLLRRNLDIFAWKPTNMTGVSRHIAEHKLNVQEGCLPVRQKKRGQARERNKAIQDEVEKLVDVGIMKEVHYHMWLSNPVMVKKHDLENVYRFQRFEQSMPQRRISAARNRLEGRIPLRISFQKLPRRIQGILTRAN